MAATLTKETIAAAGTSVTFTAATALGDSVLFANNAILLVHNEDSADHTVTLASEYVANLGSTSAANAVIVTAGDIGVIPLASVYKDSTSKLCAWTYDAVTSVSVAVI